MNSKMQALTAAVRSAAKATPPAAIPITLLGRESARALRLESQWEVRAVFRRSFYCRSWGGSFVCVGPMALGGGPLNILYQMAEPIDWEAARLRTGSTALCDGVLIHVAERFRFSLTGAETWRPAMPATPWQPADMIQNLAMLAREACTRPVRGGLQTLIPIVAETMKGLAWARSEQPWPERPSTRCTASDYANKRLW